MRFCRVSQGGKNAPGQAVGRLSRVGNLVKQRPQHLIRLLRQVVHRPRQRARHSRRSRAADAVAAAGFCNLSGFDMPEPGEAAED